MPPARLLITALTTASSKSFAPEAPAAVDETCAPHEAIRDLVAAKIGRMVAGEIGVNALVDLAVTGIAHVEEAFA